jgi:hypothetical protein
MLTACEENRAGRRANSENLWLKETTHAPGFSNPATIAGRKFVKVYCAPESVEIATAGRKVFRLLVGRILRNTDCRAAQCSNIHEYVYGQGIPSRGGQREVIIHDRQSPEAEDDIAPTGEYAPVGGS